MTSSPTLLTLLCLLVLLFSTRVSSTDFTFGGQARRVCKAYKMLCPEGKICALQTIGWPQTMKFPVCIFRKEKKVKTSICRRPPQPGRCKARFLRWYYNVHMQACSWFTYGGCGGNQNNFRSLGDCTRTCIGEDTPETTTLSYGRLKNIYKEMKEGNTGFRDISGIKANNSDDRVPLEARAPEGIDMTRDVTSSLNSVEGNPFGDQDEELSYEDRKAMRKLARRLRKQEARRRRKLEREKRRRWRKLRKRDRLSKRGKGPKRRDPNLINHREKLPKPLPPVIISPAGSSSESDNPDRRINVTPPKIRQLPQPQQIEQPPLPPRPDSNQEPAQRDPNAPPDTHSRQRGDNGGRTTQRQLTPEELGPAYFRRNQIGPSRIRARTLGDPSTGLNGFRHQKWMMDEKFNVGRRRRRRTRRRRLRRRRRRHQDKSWPIVTSRRTTSAKTAKGDTPPGYQAVSSNARRSDPTDRTGRAGFFTILEKPRQ